MGDKVQELLSNPTFLVLLAWAARELWRDYRAQKADQALNLTSLRQDNTIALRENSVRMSELAIAIAKLETKLESVEKITSHIPTMREDLSALSSKIKDLSV